MTQVNAEGEAAIDPRDAAIVQLQSQVAILTNVATALVLRQGGDVVLTESEMTALDHKFTSTQDRIAGTIRIVAKKRDGAPTGLTTEQIRDNARAAEIALPKKGSIIQAPKGLILP